jgi:hypothetical protein
MPSERILALSARGSINNILYFDNFYQYYLVFIIEYEMMGNVNH